MLSNGVAKSTENRPFEPFLLPAKGSTLDWSPVVALKDLSDASELRRSKSAVVDCQADDDGYKTEDQPPSGCEEEDGPRGRIVSSKTSKISR